ncbi:MAG TPA: 16S rRNA (uracil(1498)-N(3))-methyltransferase [Candidatus Aminicenantes bacterium]|nr:16S rRNA (uracil(1498)-N(3))-methyltransferase [Candidatus Aminicenantes bacterium]
MTANRFFINSQEINRPYSYLKGSEHHHLYHVLRKRPGEKIFLFDEKSTTYEATITKVEKDKTTLFILNSQPPSPQKVIIKLGIGLLKSKSMDLVVQKATEWGISQIFPLFTQRSVAKINQQKEAKLLRWQQIAIEAAKQSGQVHLPQIEKPCPLSEFLKIDHPPNKCFLSETGGELLYSVLKKEMIKDKKCPEDEKEGKVFLMLIGPEGGWTEEEQNYMMKYGFKKVSLGPYILRAETAAISTMAIVGHFLIED